MKKVWGLVLFVVVALAVSVLVGVIIGGCVRAFRWVAGV